jgi:predicted NAD/FAD-dependent oxidoreductase
MTTVPSLPVSVAVIGGGLAGVVCAHTLTAQRRFTVQVFEQKPEVGGRMCAQRTGHYQFDVGAQYFTVRAPRFQHYVEAWQAEGLVAEWTGRLGTLANGRLSDCEEKRRYVGVPDMSAPVRQLARQCAVRRDIQVAHVHKEGGGWRLRSTTGEDLGHYQVVVTAVPAPQAVSLLTEAPVFAARAAGVHMAGCWAVLLTFAPLLDLPFDGAFVHNSPLSWLARDSSKAGRGPSDCWVLHGSPEWSDQHTDAPRELVIAWLTTAFWQATGHPAVQPVYTAAYHWPYALPLNPIEEVCLFDPTVNMGVCGDWCGGPRVEGALASGLTLAEQILSAVSPSQP